MADHDTTTTKPLLPTNPDVLLGIFEAARHDVPLGAITAPAWTAAENILARFEPTEDQRRCWLTLGLAREIMSLTEPDDDDEEGL
jgi:hypothetical protein